jgi:hypothetical protein
MVTITQVREELVKMLRIARVKENAEEYAAGLADAIEIIDRALGSDQAIRNKAAAEFPPGTPEALQHILSVAQLVADGYSRPEATQKVADRWAIVRGTVLAAYARGLGWSTADFDSALVEPGRHTLFEKLSVKFPEHIGLIRHHLETNDR